MCGLTAHRIDALSTSGLRGLHVSHVFIDQFTSAIFPVTFPFEKGGSVGPAGYHLPCDIGGPEANFVRPLVRGHSEEPFAIMSYSPSAGQDLAFLSSDLLLLTGLRCFYLQRVDQRRWLFAEGFVRAAVIVELHPLPDSRAGL